MLAMPPSAKKTSKKRLKIEPEVPPSVVRDWVVVELTPTGEREKNLESIRKNARKILNDKTIEVFIPSVVQKVRDEFHILPFMEGYVFILHKPGLNFMRLQETNYFRSVLTKPVFDGKRKRYTLSFLSDKDLDKLRSGMQNVVKSGFSEGDIVKVVRGNYKNLKAEVIQAYEDGQHVQVYVNLASKKILLDFPASYLVKDA